MKKICVLLAAMYAFCALPADNYYVFRLKAEYQSNGQAKFAGLKLVYDAFSASAPGDSFSIQGSLDTVFYKRVNDAYRIDALSAVLYDTAGKPVFLYTFGWDTKNPRCNGYYFNQLLRGKACDSFPAAGLGTMCAELSMNWVGESFGRNITYSGGFWSQPFNITCDPDIPYVEPPLKLNAPCYFTFGNKPSAIHWYESVNSSGPWYYLDTGFSIMPAKVSVPRGMKLFNQRRYYICRVDTHRVMNLQNITTPPIGAVWFYMNPAYDSVQVIGKSCRDTGSDIVIHLRNDSFSQHKSGVGLWVFEYNDPLKPERWFLGFHKNVTKLSLNGMTGQKDPYIKVNTEGRVFAVKEGMCRFYLDFTPWTGFDCEIRWDTVIVPEKKGIAYREALNRRESCPGDRNGIWQAEPGQGDSVWFSWNGKQFLLGDTLRGLAAGAWPVRIWNRAGCDFVDTIRIGGIPEFYTPAHIDTTLCNGQQVLLALKLPGIRSAHLQTDTGWMQLADTLKLEEAGLYAVRLTGDSGCRVFDTVKIVRRNLDVSPDFLVAGMARLSDTLWAVDHSIPKPDSCIWRYDRNTARYQSVGRYSLVTEFSDTGTYKLTRIGRFGACTFLNSKTIMVLGDSTRGNNGAGLGFKGPLIQDFSIDPNPSDGQNFTIRVQLRDTADITIYKIDPVTGDVVGDIAFSGKKRYEFTAFRSYSSCVFFLKLMAGNESKTIKVVVIQ